MDLVLWRHAHAVDANPGEDDLSRVLSGRGEKQAQRIAEWLDRQLPQGTRVWASPARRTVQTVAALVRPYRVAPEIGPGGSVENLLELARWPNDKKTVLVVGHQPVLGRVAAQLLGLREAECNIKRGAVWWLRQRERQGRTEILLLSVQTPEML